MNGRKNLIIRLAVLVLTLAMAVAVPTAAETHHVSPGDKIQTAIVDAINGDEIEVDPGTYNETIDFMGKAVRLYSSGGPSVTTINGAGYHHVVECKNVEGRNTVLEGFTITGGSATGDVIPNNVGGGIYCSLSSPTIVNCNVSGNVARYGGGIYCSLSSPAIVDCNVCGNMAWYGGGIYGDQSNLAINGCKINNNLAYFEGGGLYLQLFYPVVINCEIVGNFSSTGAGICSIYSQATITNCTVSCNIAFNAGGLASWADAMENTPIIQNCILWGDLPSEIVWATGGNLIQPFIQHSDVQGGWVGTGNIDMDPCFVDANNADPNLWNLRLQPGSPCIDAGDSTVVLPMSVVNDLDGKDRYVDIDTIDDTGSGLFEFLDMGAYEFQCSGLAGDVNCDGVVNFKDVALLCCNWLAGTEPEL